MQTAPRLRRLALPNLIPIVVPDDVLHQIKYLCRSNPKLEWSGVLFYQVEGTIQEPEKMKVTLKYIHFMDIGSSGHTQFNFDESLVAFMMDNPEAMEWNYGLIHSHNNMGVFFSGEDESELDDNVANHNIYLSMIINNYMDMIAKIVFVATPVAPVREIETFTAKDETGKDNKISIKIEEPKPEPSAMMIYKTEIIMSKEEIQVNEAFKKRYAEVEEKFKKPIPAKQVPSGDNWARQYPPTQAEKDFKEGNKGNYSNREYNKEIEKPSYSKYEKMQGGELNIVDDSSNYSEEYWGGYNEPTISLEEKFAAYVLRLGLYEETDDIEAALGDIETSGLNIDSLCASIASNYGIWYAEFFEDKKLTPNKSDEEFLRILKVVFENLRIFTDKDREYDSLVQITQTIAELGMRFEQTMKDSYSKTDKVSKNTKDNKVEKKSNQNSKTKKNGQPASQQV